MSNVLRLRWANTFWRRFLGLHAGLPLAQNEALVLIPCSAVHTFFLDHAIDVVFLDADGGECRCVHALRPWRAVREKRACVVVELPAGYCSRHPDYLVRIHAALRLRVSPRLSE